MQTSRTVTPEYPTRRQIQRGIAEGRRLHAQAVSGAAKSLIAFLFARSVRPMRVGRTVAHLTG